MPTDFRTNDAANDTDAHFRKWGSDLSAALLAVGLVKAADTGQINWATVLRPTGMEQMMGFEIWRFADALQATAPVFIRIDYGAGGPPNVNPSSPMIRVSVGSGTDGLGNLTGVKSEVMYLGMYMNYGGAGQAFEQLVSGASDRVAAIIGSGYGSSDLVFGFAVERTKDAGGAPTNEGVIVQSFGAMVYIGGANYSHGGAQQQVVLFTGVQADTAPRSVYDAAPAIPHGNASNRTGVVGPDTAVFPWVAPSSRGMENPSMAFVSLWNQDIGDKAVFNAKLYGADHTYRALGGSNFPNGTLYQDDYTTTELLVKQKAANGVPNGATSALGIRWE